MLDDTYRSRFNVQMVKWLVRGAVIAALVGCSETPNPAFCDETSDCRNGFSCNLDTHGCETTIVEDGGVDSASGSCSLDDECTSGVCKDSGVCEGVENVLYVSADGVSAGACPSDARCDIVYALSKITTQQHTIRIANGTYDIASDLVVDRTKPDVTIVGGRGAVLRRASAGVVIDVRGVTSGVGPTLTLRGMTINKGVNCFWAGLRLQRALMDNASGEPIPWIASYECKLVVDDSELRDSPSDGISGMYSDLEMARSTVTGSSGFGISVERGVFHIAASTIDHNAKLGIQLFNVTSFELKQSLVSHNLLGGVASVGGPFDVTNNVVVRNGIQADDCEFGGLRLVGTGRAIHNTIALNNSPPDASYAGGIYCEGGEAGNNIIVSNQRGNEELPNAQTGGTCSTTGSLIDPSYNTPVFVDFLTDDFHIASASPAVNAGGMPQVDVDFDGEPRSDGAADVGADERP